MKKWRRVYTISPSLGHPTTVLFLVASPLKFFFYITHSDFYVSMHLKVTGSDPVRGTTYCGKTLSNDNNLQCFLIVILLPQ